LYLSNGYDFQYFISTGDSLDFSGDLKPIVKRENITSVRIYGAEISMDLNPLKWLIVRGNFSLNHSEIIRYKVNPLADTTNLKGKSLAEVPIRQASLETVFLNSFVNAGLVWVYIGPQWVDEVNSDKIDSWNTFNLRLWKDFKSIKLTLDIQDLFDNPYTDKKGFVSPGRFFQFSATYSFK